MDFRRAFWAAAAREGNINAKFDMARVPRDLLAAVLSTDRELLVQSLVTGLRELPTVWTHYSAFRMIISDLDVLTRYYVPMMIDIELSGTPAGEAVARMRADMERSIARRERQREDIAEQKRIKREQRAIAHADRVVETRRKNAIRLELLATLAQLSPAERLSRVASDPAIRLDCVSADLIPSQKRDLIDLSKGDAATLLVRIGQRKGPWGQLRRMLNQLSAADGLPTSQTDEESKGA